MAVIFIMTFREKDLSADIMVQSIIAGYIDAVLLACQPTDKRPLKLRCNFRFLDNKTNTHFYFLYYRLLSYMMMLFVMGPTDRYFLHPNHHSYITL